ncbi:MAG: peptide ABC transporter substrate-binding protein [Firmicutes bacterium]|nr:peptide ABC transporter substrate-binding protein [Bacillota bacterium]
MGIKKITALLLIVVMFFSVVGCEANNKPVKDDKEDKKQEEKNYTPAYGGELVVPISYVDTLNPLLNNNKSLYYFNKLIYEGLFEFDNNHNVKGILAENYNIDDTGRRITIKLKENVSWHDGEIFNAEDVKFTFDTLMRGNSLYNDMLVGALDSSDIKNLQHIIDVSIIDDYNIEIYFNKSYSNALESLTFPIIPKHQFSTYKNALNKDYIKKAIGTGPYKFVEYNKLKNIRLTANDNWWQGKPYIENITGNILSDKELSITSFEAGNIDLSLASGVDWEKYFESKNIEIYEFITQEYEFLGFNFDKEIFKGQKGKNLRKAIAYAIDTQSIIKKVYLGHSTEVDTPIYPDSWLLKDKSVIYGYNAKRAREILEADGWSDTDDDKIYEDINGKELSIKLLTNSYNKLRFETANMIKKDLENIGIKVEIEKLGENKNKDITEKEAIEQWNEIKNKVKDGDYEMALLSWDLSIVPDLSFAFHSKLVENNITNYKNEKMDNLLESAFRAKSRQVKKEKYEEISKLIKEDLPYVSLFFKNSALLVNNRIKGDINPKSYNIYNNIDKWFIPEELQNK